MLRQPTKEHITALSDGDLMEYLTVGVRMYEPEAVAFAREELTRRNLSDQQQAELRSSAMKKLNPPRLLELPPLTPESCDAVVCDRCGIEAPARYVVYRQQIGLLLMRFWKRSEARLCKRCNNQVFAQFTLITLFFGWWGVISFFATIFTLIANATTWLATRSLEAPVPDATPPLFDGTVLARVQPDAPLIVQWLIERMDINDIARHIAPRAGVTPGQAWRAIDHLRRTIVVPAQVVQVPTPGVPVVMQPTPIESMEPQLELEVLSDPPSDDADTLNPPTSR